MYSGYTSVANAAPSLVLKDLADLVTNTALSPTQLSTACDKPNTSITNTVASGWSYVSHGGGDGSVWTANTTFQATVGHTAACYGGGVYVFGTSTGGILTSTDTNNWTVRTSPFGSSQITSITYSGTKFVAVGYSNKIATSSDGVTWTLQTAPFGTNNINEVLWVPFLNKFFAVDAQARVSSSSDGITWSTATSISGFTALYSIACSSNTIMVGGNAGLVSTSTDGTTWSATSTITAITGSVLTISYGNGVWVAGSTSGIIVNSTDGTTWSSNNLGTVLGTTSIIQIVYTNNVFIAIGTSGSVSTSMAYSSDGYIWDLRNPISAYLSCLCVNPSGYWVAGVSASGTYITKSVANPGGYGSALMSAPCNDDVTRLKYVRLYLDGTSLILQLMEYYTNHRPVNTLTGTIQTLSVLSTSQYWTVYAIPTVALFNGSSQTPKGAAEISRKYAQDSIANGYPQWGLLTLSGSTTSLNRLRHPTATSLTGYILGLSNLTSGPQGKIKDATLKLNIPLIPLYYVDGANATGGGLTTLTDIWLGPYSFGSEFDETVANGQIYSMWVPNKASNNGCRFWIPKK